MTEEKNGYLRKSDFWKLIAVFLVNSLFVVFAAGILYAKLESIGKDIDKIQAQQEKTTEFLQKLNVRVTVLESRD